jgi:L-threonylcarbamoyladenylate synthase
MYSFPKYIADVLVRGGVGVIPTDTIYGIVGSALDKKTVERIYKLRKRNAKKPFIILIPSVSALGKFGVKLNKYHKAFLNEAWPGPISVVLSVAGKKYAYLHRGKNSLAFRIPASPQLQALLKKTGPLVAPSANWEGKKPAETIQEAQRFFGPNVEFYMDSGRVKSNPSALIDFTGKAPIVLRK